MKLLDDVRGILDRSGIRFAVVGAAALAYRGVSRATLDIDLLTIDHRILERSRWDGLSRGGAHVDVRVAEADDPLGGVVRFRRHGEREVDLILGRPGWQSAVVDAAEFLGPPGGAIPVARPADLILLKLYAGSPQDAWDIQQLLGDHPAADLVAEVTAKVRALPAEAAVLWKRIHE